MRPISEVKADLWNAVSNAHSTYEREILRLIIEIADHVEARTRQDARSRVESGELDTDATIC